MKRYAVTLAPLTQAQARRISDWWRENRPSAPNLFEDEMAAVLGRVAVRAFDGKTTARPGAILNAALVQKRRSQSYAYDHRYFASDDLR